MTTSSSPTFIHDPDFYLPDGDLAICSAPSVQDGAVAVFCVHKVVMAYNSPVFCGMLNLPAHPEGQETHEGVPVVRVTDSAEEIHALLAALYDPGSLSASRWDPDAPLHLMPAMKLASKYEIDAVRKRVVALLEDAWPRSFEQWLRFHAEVDVIRNLHEAASDRLIGGKLFTDRVPEPAAAVRIARDFDIPSVLPFAYYTLAGIPLSNEWDKCHTSPEELWGLAVGFGRVARWRLLDVVDMGRVLGYREELTLLTTSNTNWVSSAVVKSVLSAAAQDCLGGLDPCSGKAEAIRALWMKNVSSSWWNSAYPDPLSVMQSVYEGHLLWDLCELCEVAVKKCIRERQEAVWEACLGAM